MNEWLHNEEYARSYLEQSARKLNLAQVVDPERDGFFVELTLVKTFGRGGKNGGTQPNLICWSSEEDEEIHHARTIEEFLEACEALTEVENNDRPRKVFTFFHNLRGFDGNFVLEALYDQGRAMENPLTQGGKIFIF